MSWDGGCSCVTPVALCPPAGPLLSGLFPLATVVPLGVGTGPHLVQTSLSKRSPRRSPRVVGRAPIHPPAWHRFGTEGLILSIPLASFSLHPTSVLPVVPAPYPGKARGQGWMAPAPEHIPALPTCLPKQKSTVWALQGQNMRELQAFSPPLFTSGILSPGMMSNAQTPALNFPRSLRA